MSVQNVNISIAAVKRKDQNIDDKYIVCFPLLLVQGTQL